MQQIQKTAPELLAPHCLTDDVLIEKYLVPMLNAHETEFFADNEEVINRKVVAWGPRATALATAIKIRGLYVKEQENEGPKYSA